jgi:small subunit ribosomal protein S17
MAKMKDLGLQINPPKNACNDKHCPFHGSLSVRGRVLEGLVVSSKMMRTVVVERNYLHFVPKFVRYERRRNHLHAHNPACIDAKSGDKVKIMECRPISKSVSFVVLEKTEEK